MISEKQEIKTVKVKTRYLSTITQEFDGCITYVGLSVLKKKKNKHSMFNKVVLSLFTIISTMCKVTGVRSVGVR